MGKVLWFLKNIFWLNRIYKNGANREHLQLGLKLLRVDHRNFLCFMNVSNPNQTSVRFIKIAIKECIAVASSSIIFEFLLKDKD